eukprot:2517006-Karenia_brevis.AAC.1
MRVFIQELSGDSTCLVVDPQIKVADVKGMIEVSLGFPTLSQSLHFEGHPLEDMQTLAEANVQHRGTLHL